MTIVECAPSLPSAGQGIDVRDSAQEVIKRMGIFDRIRDKRSHEEGLKVVDSNNHCFACFGADTSGKGESIGSDVEILREELVGILLDVTKDDVSYIFGDMVESLEEKDKEVTVNFANGTPTTVFDLVVTADGIDSKIHVIAYSNGASHLKSLHSYVSYFSITLS